LSGFSLGCIEYFAICLWTAIDLLSPTADSCASLELKMGWNRGRVLGLGQGRRWWLIHPPVTQFLAVSKVKHCEWLSGAATQPSPETNNNG